MTGMPASAAHLQPCVWFAGHQFHTLQTVWFAALQARQQSSADATPSSCEATRPDATASSTRMQPCQAVALGCVPLPAPACASVGNTMLPCELSTADCFCTNRFVRAVCQTHVTLPPQAARWVGL